MSGLTRKTVRAATRELDELELLSASKRVSRAGRRSKHYQLSSVVSDGVQMPSIFIDGGNWSELTPAAKSLSMAFRFFGRVRPDLDPDCGEWLKDDDWSAYVTSRIADYCNAEPVVLRQFAGIGPRVWSSAIQSLQKNYFIEPDPESDTYWRVLIWPPYVNSVAYLNSKLEGEEGKHEQ